MKYSCDKGMAQIGYYIMDLIRMNVVMGGHIKAVIHKKEVLLIILTTITFS
jgi:hypothetical protein